jgi:hypothetical protein
MSEKKNLRTMLAPVELPTRAEATQERVKRSITPAAKTVTGTHR